MKKEIGNRHYEVKTEYIENEVIEPLSKVEYWNEDLFKKKYKEKIMEVWNENKYDIQSDYENNLEEYLTNFGL